MKFLIAVAAIMADLTPAWATEPTVPRPPQIEASTPWTAILVSLITAVAICIVGFKNCRRTHLD